MSKPVAGHFARSVAILGNASYAARRVRIIRSGLILVMLWMSSGVKCDDETVQVIIGAAGATQARPLSVEWLEYWSDKYPFGNDDGSRLVIELTKSRGVDANAWSQRTAAELRTAIISDDLLKSNAWNDIRCSRSGCVAAIDSLDPGVRSRDSTIRLGIFKARLLAYTTPRRELSHHVDLTVLETDGVPGPQPAHFYVLFFVFPDDATPAARDLPQAISRNIGAEMKAAYVAISRQEWADAIKELNSADSVKGITVVDRKAIYENEGFAYARLHNDQGAEVAYEKALPDAFVASTRDALEDTRRLLYLSVLNGHYLKSIEVGRTLVEYWTSQDSVDTSASSSGSFKFLRTYAA